MKKLILVIIALLAIGFAAHAEVRHEWKQQGLSVSVPSDFKVSKNAADGFEAGNAEFKLTIKLFEAKDLTLASMKTSLDKMAKEAKLDVEDAGELVLTSLDGAYIEGLTGDKGMVFVLLADEKSKKSFLATLVYEEGNEGAATNIMNSFAIK